MGGLTSPIATAAVSTAERFVKGFSQFVQDEGPGYYRSAKALLDKTDVGKVWGDYLEHTFKPAVAKTGQQLLEQKISAGMAPDIAAREAGREALYHARQQFIGPKDEALIKFIHTAEAKHGLVYANQMADAMSVYFDDAASYWRRNKVTVTPGAAPIDLKSIGVNQRVKYTPASATESNLRRSLSWMYTPLVAIPHVGQLSNIILDNSFKDIAKGLSDYFSSGVNKQRFVRDLLDSGSLFDEAKSEIFANASGGGLARKLVDHPGFGWVRRQEISIAAATGKHAAISAAERFNSTGDRWAEHTLAKLGIVPQDVIRQGGQLTNEQIQKAMYAEANRTIFFRDALQTPWRWEENTLARLNSQYRHYIFRQGRFLADVFKNSYKYGGTGELTKAVATYATVFPLFGEIVHSLENLSTAQNPFQRDKTGTDEYFDAMGHAAGLGVFYSMWRSGQFNGGIGFLSGPFINTLTDIFIGIPTDISRGRGRAAARRVTTKLGWPGKIISPMLKKDKE